MLFNEFIDSTSLILDDIKDTFKSFISDLSKVIEEIGSPELAMIATPIAIATAVLFPELEVVELAIPELIVAVGKICELISDVAKIIIGDDGIENDDLGMRATDADKSPENFDNYTEYVEYLKTITPDYERLSTMTPEERLPYSIMGASIREHQISETIDVNVPVETYAVAEKIHMPAQEVSGYLHTAEDKGIDELPNLGDYFAKDKLDRQSQVEVRECLVEGISNTNPELTKDQVEEKLFDYTSSFQSDTIEE